MAPPARLNFFAVITEAFFEKPHQLRYRHPQLYDQLELFFQQDPAAYFSPDAGSLPGRK